jgi:hypothetical protein
MEKQDELVESPVTRFCKRCDTLKDVSEFYVARYKHCKACQQQMSRDYKHRNKETIAAYNSKYKQEHREDAKVYNKNYSINNRETIQRRSTAYQKERRYTDVNFKLSKILRSRLNCEIREVVPDRTLTLLGTTVDMFRQWIEFNFVDGMDWSNHGTVWHIDHVLPVCKFDLEVIDHRFNCFNWCNMKPLEAIKNLSKNGKIDIEYIQSHLTQLRTYSQLRHIDISHYITFVHDSFTFTKSALKEVDGVRETKAVRSKECKQ